MFVQALLIALASPCFARRRHSGTGAGGGTGGSSLSGSSLGGIIAAIVVGIVLVFVALFSCCCCRGRRAARLAAAAAAKQNPEAGQPMTEAEGSTTPGPPMTMPVATPTYDPAAPHAMEDAQSQPQGPWISPDEPVAPAADAPAFPVAATGDAVVAEGAHVGAPEKYTVTSDNKFSAPPGPPLVTEPQVSFIGGFRKP